MDGWLGVTEAEETGGRRAPSVLWEPGRLCGPGELWSHPWYTCLLLTVSGLGIQLKPNACWHSGSPPPCPPPYASPFCPSVLSVPPSTAPSSLLTHPGSSRAGKEGEKLTYSGDMQEQVSPEFSASWIIFY